MAATFRDNQSREWKLYIDIPAARRIRKELGVDILNTQEGLQQVNADPILLCDVLYMLCEQQCERLKVSDVEFGQALVGEVLEQAVDAYVEALINFTPPRQGKILSSMQQTAVSLQETLTGIAQEKIPAALQQLQAALSGK